MIKAIIFDVDNTLIDAGDISAKAYLSTAKELGLRLVSAKKIKSFFGIPSHIIIKKLWPKTDIKEFQEIKHKKILSKKVKQIPGAKGIVASLYGKYTLGLLSSKTRALMYPHLKQINLSTKYFKFIYSADDVKFHKPDPKVFSNAKSKLKLKDQEILYVGDSIYDFIAAKKAKLNFTAVLTGHYKKKDFLRLGLKKGNILKSIKDLQEWLSKNG